ncbi:hypothetical protein HDU86_007634 [Geranomyces michiganensis]|nr:hypothetical protein HDU86_007634 [Geranomyces michiganensis]
MRPKQQQQQRVLLVVFCIAFAQGLPRQKRAPLATTRTAAAPELNRPEKATPDAVIASTNQASQQNVVDLPKREQQHNAAEGDSRSYPEEETLLNSEDPPQGPLEPPVILESSDQMQSQSEAEHADQSADLLSFVPIEAMSPLPSTGTAAKEEDDGGNDKAFGEDRLAPSINLAPGTELEIPAPQSKDLASGTPSSDPSPPALGARDTMVDERSQSGVNQQFWRPLDVGISNASVPQRNFAKRADQVPTASMGLASGPYVCSKGAVTGTYMVSQLIEALSLQEQSVLQIAET